MRKSAAAVAIIRKFRGGEMYYLAQWNRHWRSFNLVAGHKRRTESFRECVTRELCEELNLPRNTGFKVSPKPINRLEYIAWSRRAAATTNYAFEIFKVRLSPASLGRIKTGELTRWLSLTEILSGKCADGKPISRTVRRVIQLTTVP